MRLSNNGVPDSTFGTFGIVQTDISHGNAIERIEEVFVQMDEKILVAGDGFDDNGLGPFYALVRYETNGQLDTTFGNKGIKIIYNDPLILQDAVIQPDGKILIGGYYDLGPSADFQLRRFHSDGSVDDNFGEGGKVRTDLSGQSDYVVGIVVEPDGRIFVSGGANFTTSTSDIAIARYNPDGSLDASYGNNGFEIISLPSESRVIDLARQADGKYVLCGASNHLDGEFHVLLIRIKPDGGLDETFGDQGVVYTVLPESYHGAIELVIQNNNYIVLGGNSMESTSGSDFTLSRYIVDDVVSTKDYHVETASLVASPNPCKVFITLDVGKASDEFHCIISDVTGNLMMDQALRTDAEGRVKIDTRHLIPGYYSVFLENKIMRGIASFVVQN